MDRKGVELSVSQLQKGHRIVYAGNGLTSRNQLDVVYVDKNIRRRADGLESVDVFVFNRNVNTLTFYGQHFITCNTFIYHGTVLVAGFGLAVVRIVGRNAVSKCADKQWLSTINR